MKPKIATENRYPLNLRRGVHKALVHLASQRSAAMLTLGLASVALQPVMAGPFPAEFELSSLLVANNGDGSAGTAFNGVLVVDGVGHSVSAAGDVNGDNIGDFIMSARFASPNGRSDAGQTYVVFGNGQGWSAEFELSSLLLANGGDGSAGFVLNGVDPGDSSGESVSAAGDFNGDGVGDTNDNCQLVANPGQCDTNGDGFGNHCDADLDDNGMVNSFDLSQMRSNYGLSGPNDADLDCNETVNSFDLSIMRQGFGSAPGPSGLVH